LMGKWSEVKVTLVVLRKVKEAEELAVRSL
jgi:hypothetical protein